MKEKNVVIKKKCPYCFLHISNDETGFLLKTDGARFISPALNDVVTPKKDIPYVLMAALLLVPKPYAYLKNQADPTLPNEWNYMNCAIIIDASLYLLMIILYFVQRAKEIRQERSVTETKAA